MFIQNSYALGLTDKIAMIKDKKIRDDGSDPKQGMSASEFNIMKSVIKQLN
jgi:hypothetical protein